jgi:hypothetical protein
MPIVPQFPQAPGRLFEQLIAGLSDRLRKVEARILVLDPGVLVTTRVGVIPGSYTSGQPTVKFTGQPAATGPYPVWSGYTPLAGDTVLCVPYGRSYIVMGTFA